MCGIAGFLSFHDASTLQEDVLLSMRERLLHRGPDDAGLWMSADQSIGLAHRRLSIIDLSPSATQPMSNENDSLHLVFNGEIYNHLDIRTALRRSGRHGWKTDHSDTEVILHAYEEWGIDCLHRFRGPFAFALWDAQQECLWLVRDRIGIKPLYYSIHHNRIHFASEIKALLAVPDQERTVNEEAFFHYLSFLTTPAPMTLFKGIQKLPGGCWLKVNRRGDITQQRYWDVWDHTQSLDSCSEQEICDRLLEALKQAVHYRQVSDVPVGIFLSGGIDSSLNTALFSRKADDPVHTFSIGYDADYESYQNEFSHARIMAEQEKTVHHERTITLDDMLALLPELVYLQDEPIADPVCVPVYYVSQLARRHGMKVCQVGEGSDELFWGYPWWRFVHRMERFNRLPMISFLSQAGLLALQTMGRTDSLYAEWLRRSSLHQPLFWGGAEAFTHSEKQRLLSSRLQNRFHSLTSWDALQPLYRRFWDRSWEPSRLHWMSYCDLNLRLPELLLMRVDKMSMGVGLECRVPFLDHKVVELAFSVSESLKTKNGDLKYLLKKSIQGIIPDSILTRQKQGFGVPICEWLLDKLGETAQTELLTFCRQTDLLNEQELRRILGRKNDPRIWYLLNLALWWKTFIGENPTRL